MDFVYVYSDGTNSYAWDTVAFVQTPQRFTQENNTDDPLGNNATIQFDVINRGKDGIAGNCNIATLLWNLFLLVLKNHVFVYMKL